MSNSRVAVRFSMIAILGVLDVCLSSGCASMRAFSDGRKQLDLGDFDAAVTSFQEAHDLWPENKHYFRTWCRAVEKAIEWHKEQSSAEFKERRLAPALSHVERALRYCDLGGDPIPGKPSKECGTACGLSKGPPRHPHTLCGVVNVDEAELVELRSALERAMGEAERRRNAGEAQMAARAWDEAVTTLRQAAELDRSSRQAQDLLSAAIDGAVKHHLALATECLECESWDACRRECEVVDLYRPGHREAQSLRKSANDRQKARLLQGRAAEAVQAREYLTAVQLLEEAVSLWPDDSSVSAALLDAKNRAADSLLVEARSQLSVLAYSAAIRLLDKAKSLAPGRSEIGRALAEATMAWADSLLADARKLFAGGANELAWVYAARACAICAEHVLARQDFDRYAASVRDELRCAIAVFPISPGGPVPTETVRACEMITTALKAQSAPHLHIVERSRLANVLTEQDLARTGLLDSAALNKVASKLSNADLLLFVSTATWSNDSQETERRDSVTYVAGKKLVANPAYAQAQAAVDQAHQELETARVGRLGMMALGGLLGSAGEAEAKLLGAGLRGAGGIGAQQAKEKYDNAVAELRQTPQLIEVADERVYEFPVLRITRKATITCSMRLVDVASADVLWNEDNLACTVTQSDTYIESEPQYGVPGRRAVLSAPEQLYAEACERLQGKIDAACQALLSRRSYAYIARARSASDPAEAAAHRVHYLFDPGPRPSAEAIRDAIAGIFDGDLDDSQRERGCSFLVERLNLTIASAANSPQETPKKRQ